MCVGYARMCRSVHTPSRHMRAMTWILMGVAYVHTHIGFVIKKNEENKRTT
jgi:hypothetical protein